MSTCSVPDTDEYTRHTAINYCSISMTVTEIFVLDMLLFAAPDWFKNWSNSCLN